MYSAPIPIGFLYFAMLMALAAAIPAGLIVFNWLGTLSGGSISMRAPMLFALGAVVFTTFGLLGELAQSVIPVGWQLAQTQTAWGDTHLALVGAGVLGGFAGLYYWFPKISGRLMGESLGRASFWAIVLRRPPADRPEPDRRPRGHAGRRLQVLRRQRAVPGEPAGEHRQRHLHRSASC